jgi:hypothetical protein
MGPFNLPHSMGYISSRVFVTVFNLVFTPCPVSLLSRHCHIPPKCSTIRSTSSKPTVGTSLWFCSSRIHGRARRLQILPSSLLAPGYLATGHSLSKEWLLPCRIHTFKYEKTLIGGVEKVISNPHANGPRDGGMGGWARRAERIENWHSKRFGVVTGSVDVLVHMRPLKGVLNSSPVTLPLLADFTGVGLKRLDNGALVKDYEGPEKETETAVQLSLLEVLLEDPRYQEQIPPPISEEFPEGTKVFFLGEHAYGTAAQVSSTTLTSMAVVLAVRDSPSLNTT